MPIIFFIIISISHSAYSSQYPIDRYTYIPTTATKGQNNELGILVEVNFPKSIGKIIPAVKYLLLRSSYQLVLDYRAAILGNIDLPEVHKKIGPIKLKQAIELLIGNAWRLDIDHIHRVITILLKQQDSQQDSQYIANEFTEHLNQIVTVNIHKDSFESVIKKILPNGNVWTIDAKPEILQYQVSIVSEDLTRLEVIDALKKQIGIKGVFYPKIKTYIFRLIRPQDTIKEVGAIIK